MADLLARREAPLTGEEWKTIDDAVVRAARRQLVARRFIQIFGPLGAGIQDIDFDTFRGADIARIDMLGRVDTEPVESVERIHEKIPLVYKDFIVYWRDIETSRRLSIPLDVSAAAAASAFVAQREDTLIFNGNADLGFEGLLTADGRNSLDARDWDEAGAAFDDVVRAIQLLVDNGFFGPYAVAVSPRRFAQMHRVYANTGVLEINHIRDVATAGVFQSPAISDNGLVLSTGVQNVDIAVAQDFVAAYLGPENLNHPFRVLESLVLRIKRPGAICTFEPTGATEKPQQSRRPSK
ncbi:MAG: bacteriocin family protein [Armatimonadetes bacterium]|nr:bacteriocin family protein [Armatimonadota bacterium]